MFEELISRPTNPGGQNHEPRTSRITAGPDGSISVAVDGDVGVQEIEPGMEDPGMEPGMEEPGMEEPGMEEPGMEPGIEEPGMEEPHAEPDADNMGGPPDGDVDDIGMQPVADMGDEGTGLG